MKSYPPSSSSFVTLILYLLSGVLAVFANIAVAQDYRIGVVDARAILEQSPQAENMAQALRAEFEGRNRELIEMRQLLTDMDLRLTNDASILSDSQRSELERERFRLSRDLARAEEIYKEDISYRRNEILTALQEEIIEAIRAVSLQYKFDIVLSEGVNWASSRVNMTPMVIEYMKARAKEN